MAGINTEKIQSLSSLFHNLDTSKAIPLAVIVLPPSLFYYNHDSHMGFLLRYWDSDSSIPSGFFLFFVVCQSFGLCVDDNFVNFVNKFLFLILTHSKAKNIMLYWVVCDSLKIGMCRVKCPIWAFPKKKKKNVPYEYPFWILGFWLC